MGFYPGSLCAAKLLCSSLIAQRECALKIESEYNQSQTLKKIFKVSLNLELTSSSKIKIMAINSLKM